MRSAFLASTAARAWTRSGYTLRSKDSKFLNILPPKVPAQFKFPVQWPHDERVYRIIYILSH